jgi:hypothetical protein
VKLAYDSGLAPLLYRRLKSTSRQTEVPAEAWQKLRLAYLNSANKAKRRSQRLHTELRTLRDNDIPVVVLKGACLAETVYADPALRTMCDVDLLVRRTDLPRVQDALLRTDCGPQERKEAEAIHGGRKHLEPLYQDGLAIETHWTIVSPANPFRIDHAGLWDRAQPATIAGVEVLVLGTEDLLLHLCLHMAFDHAFRAGPKPLLDIAELIRVRGHAIDWPAFMTRAREWRAERYVGVAMLLAQEMAGADVPGGVLEGLAIGRLSAKVRQAARESVLRVEKSSPYRVPDINELLMDKRPLVRLARISKAVFPPPQFMSETCRVKPYSLRMYAGYASRLGQALAGYPGDAWRVLRLRRWLSGH